MTDAQLLEAYEEFPEPIQPGERALYHPAPGPAPRMLVAQGSLASRGHMGPIPAVDHRGPGGLATVPLIRTQVVLRRRAGHDYPVEGGRQEADIMAVRPADDYRQRDSTGVHEQAALRAFFSPDPSDWPRRPLGPGALSRGRHRRSATPRQCLPAHHIPPGLAARAGRRPRRASRRGNICGWNWGSRTGPWVAPSTGSLCGAHTRCPRRPAGDPRASGRPRACAGTVAPSGVSGAGSTARPWPTTRRIQSRIGVRS